MLGPNIGKPMYPISQLAKYWGLNIGPILLNQYRLSVYNMESILRVQFLSNV